MLSQPFFLYDNVHPHIFKHLYLYSVAEPVSYALDKLFESVSVVYHIWQILHQFLLSSVYFIAIPGPKEQFVTPVDLRGAQSAALGTASVSVQWWGYRTSRDSAVPFYNGGCLPNPRNRHPKWGRAV